MVVLLLSLYLMIPAAVFVRFSNFAVKAASLSTVLCTTYVLVLLAYEKEVTALPVLIFVLVASVASSEFCAQLERGASVATLRKYALLHCSVLIFAIAKLL